jgi:FAD/FMN-containing dehydrogenase
MPAAKLQKFLKPDQIRTSTEDIEHYGRDWTKFHDIKAQGVLFPSSTEEVQKIVQWASAENQKLVPSGGRTGLSGGAVATGGEWIVSLERMNRILSFNAVDRTLLAQSGAITQSVQEAAQEKGYLFPVDFAATGSSTMGGMVATNAGGVRVLKYGLTRNWVASLTVVTGKGQVLRLNQGLVKNATGYDLRHLFIGSEGTLGFVTEVEVNLTKPPASPQTLFLSVPQLEDVPEIFVHFRDQCDLLAFELLSHQALEYVLNSHPNLFSPLSSPGEYYLLIEADAPNEESLQTLMDGLDHALEKGWIQDGAMAQSEEQRKQFWSLREFISESIAPRTPYKNDVSVRISRATEFINSMQKVFDQHYPDFEVIWFGHIGDGNLHLNVLKPQAMEKDEFYKTCQSLGKILFDEIKKLGGAISAEHGVGLIKKEHLHNSRSQDEIDLMKAIKACFDPNGVINPGKIF